MLQDRTWHRPATLVQALITACVYDYGDVSDHAPLQILLYGSWNHNVGQLVGEPHAETGEEG